MATKHIEVRTDLRKNSIIHEIKDWIDLVENSFDSGIDRDHISLQIGNRSAKTYFCPTTWDGAQMLAQYVVCHLIVSQGILGDGSYLIDKPYFKGIFDKYSADLARVSFKTDDEYPYPSLWECTTR